MKKNNASDEEIKGAMEAKIYEVGPTNVSKHTSNPKQMNTVDFGINSLMNDIGSEKMEKLKNFRTIFMLIKINIMKLKFSYLLIILVVSFLKVSAQDLSDEKTINSIKSFKFINGDKKNKSYSLILNDNSFLSIKFNVVQDGELNATYTFIKTPPAILFKNTKEFNEKYIKDNIFQNTVLSIFSLLISILHIQYSGLNIRLK